MFEEDRAVGEAFVKMLLSEGLITQEQYDRAIKVTDERIEYNKLRMQLGAFIAGGMHIRAPEIRKIRRRLKELEPILKKQRKEQKEK